MGILKSISNFFSKRNLAQSDSYISRMGAPIYSKWKIKNAVKEGYSINSWVYRAISINANSASSVPWQVLNKEGEPVEGHHLTELFNNPNPFISRQDLFQLIVSWLELSGNAYSKKVKADGRTVELWPISPDRLAPIPSKQVDEWIKGYALDEARTVTFLPEEIIHNLYFNPASPLVGIGPLEAVSKTIDVDNAINDFNLSSMQHQGILSGVFSFKREFSSQKEADTIQENLNEKYAGSDNAGKFVVLGSEANYIRTSATPVELNFTESKKMNCEQIFIAFGIPPQYAGVQESSTYNNYQTSELIYWFQKIVPLLSDLQSTYNMSFRDELGDGERLAPKLTAIPTIRKALQDKGLIAKDFWEMGVPLSQLNDLLEIGLSEYEGWDKSHIKTTIELDTKKQDKENNENKEEIELEKRYQKNYQKKTSLLTRDFDNEVNILDSIVEEKSETIQELLDEQKDLIFKAIQKSAKNDKVKWFDVQDVLFPTWETWEKTYNEMALETALIMAETITISKRSTDVEDAISEYFKQEAFVLTELSFIEATTTDAIIAQVEQGIEDGWTVTQLQTAILDVAALSPARALMLSRTINGTAGSLGQFHSAKSVNATKKHWRTARDGKVRDQHIKREQEGFIPIDKPFELGGMFPLDPVLAPGDRINCRCSLSFKD